ncbi:TetR/AcrR family transcriptional regulator [Mesorhizobium sp. M7A.F.Ca.US.001.01.1.1]|nr:TetR/AcrR family transcriptional regulator [Mesorhizobium sp. BR1-1-3]RVA57551.1 TetR/AcrR family transcriptional regulator [Mesorhizobium sp. M7A.F.Ca.US.001.01.1.1]
MSRPHGYELIIEYTFIGVSSVRRSSDQTRPAILQVAFKPFRRRGFFRVGMDETASTAGVTKKTLYYHSKDGIDLSGGAEQLVDKLFGGLATWSSKPP